VGLVLRPMTGLKAFRSHDIVYNGNMVGCVFYTSTVLLIAACQNSFTTGGLELLVARTKFTTADVMAPRFGSQDKNLVRCPLLAWNMSTKSLFIANDRQYR
jgi:hypothetical protein